jgi:hypothetical protein
MTNENEPLSPDDLRAFLSALEEDAGKTSDNRDAIRRAVLAEFDRGAIDTGGARSRDNRWPAEASGPEGVVFDLETVQPATASRLSPIVLIVAACVIALVGLALVLIDDEHAAQIETAAATRLEGPGFRPLPAELAGGRYSTEAIGGGVTFEVPDGLSLTVLEEGLVELAPRTVDNAGSLSLADSDVTSAELGASIEAMADADNVVASTETIEAQGVELTRWRLRLPPALFVSTECSSTGDCLTVPVLIEMVNRPVLDQASDTFLTVVPIGDRMILIIERPGANGESITDVGALVTSTITPLPRR